MDISIVDENGRPVDTMRLPPREHEELLGKAAEGEHVLLLRLAQHGSAADFMPEELEELGEELDAVASEAQGGSDFARIVSRLQALVRKARDGRARMEAR